MAAFGMAPVMLVAIIMHGRYSFLMTGSASLTPYSTFTLFLTPRPQTS
jgi:hypothetical protein